MQLETLDITQIVVAVFGLAGVVVPILISRSAGGHQPRTASNQSKEQTRPKSTKGKYLAVVCIGCVILAMNLAVLVWRYWKPQDKPEISIAFPTQGSLARMTEMIQGNSHSIPIGEAIWIVIQPFDAGTYYPQNDKVRILDAGDWSSLSYIGTDQDTGKEFQIIAVLADKKSQISFAAYLDQYRDNTKSPGLARLPDGARPFAQVAVKRK